MKRHPKNKSVLQRYEMQYPFAMEYHSKLRDDLLHDSYISELALHECELFALRYVENYNNLLANYEYALNDVEVKAVAHSALHDSARNNYGVFNMHNSAIVTCNGYPYSLVVKIDNFMTVEIDYQKFADMDTATGYHICIASMHVRLGN